MLYKCPFSDKIFHRLYWTDEKEMEVEEVSDFKQVPELNDNKRNRGFLLPLPMNNFHLILFHSKSLHFSCKHISIFLHRIWPSTVPAVRMKGQRNILNSSNLWISVFAGAVSIARKPKCLQERYWVGCPGLYAQVHVWKGERKLTHMQMGGFWITSRKERKGQGGANSLRSGRQWVQEECSA